MGFRFYQQHPEFCGGLQIISTHNMLDSNNKQFRFGGGPSYLELGPLMHIQWLNSEVFHKNTKQYFILAAARCDEAVIIKYKIESRQINKVKNVKLGSSIFCLYCDWQIMKEVEHKLKVIAAVSTSQSTVYTFQVYIDISLKGEANQLQINQISQYNKHEYAVWACKVNCAQNQKVLMVTGDEVDCLYLYDLSHKQLLAKNKKAHTQGICEIMWKNQKTILTGSFDGSIAQICIDNFSQTLKRIQLGGTIWRIIPISEGHVNSAADNLFICNSSQKKFQIINFNTSETVWDSGSQHTSLAYAADFNGKFIVTASFYDQQVRLWSIGSL